MDSSRTGAGRAAAPRRVLTALDSFRASASRWGRDVWRSSAAPTCSATRRFASVAWARTSPRCGSSSTRDRRAARTPVLVFDEFHHGFGVHGGSLKAAVGYLSRANTGHLLAQASGRRAPSAAGDGASAARAAETATQIMRRSPLEHAAALGRAYEDVGATRTATSSLVGGLRTADARHRRRPVVGRRRRVSQGGGAAHSIVGAAGRDCESSARERYRRSAISPRSARRWPPSKSSCNRHLQLDHDTHGSGRSGAGETRARRRLDAHRRTGRRRSRT